ncbi:hypothetical protein BC351_02240 [Paenibacillus ferrarius]|uniref:Uncharacterized protein n=1 Tax=Paenibacillus ferrarius TaxID=1469647 RepID=A0A1V4HT14_9BACL|nr:ankyrin repeat domain-containing protein [Paenibacillus ferrarius]OPH62079.1 hypothetical protein BC351_02240 [Paenibacillus ferrarius]
MKARGLVLLNVMFLLLSSCTGKDNSSFTIAATPTTSVPIAVVEPSPTNKIEDLEKIANQILSPAVNNNNTEIARLMDSVNSPAALNSLFFQVILERIKYHIDLDVEPIVQMFQNHKADVNAIDARMKQSLIVASACTVGDFVKPLILAGADVNPPADPYKPTPLSCVSSRRNPELVRFLLEHGARLDIPNPLLSAMRPFGHSNFQEENIEIVKLLIEAGAAVNDKDNNGNTPLALAAMYNQKELVTYLIDHGAHVNVKNNDGRTPLIEAVEAVEGAKSEDDVLEVVKIMLQAGADPKTIPDRNGNTALENFAP